jgi:hypothetical protein
MAQRQAAEADSKTVNMRVANAMAKRNAKNNKAHKPALNHPWRKYPDGKSAPEGRNVTCNRGSTGESKHCYFAGKGTFLFSVDSGFESNSDCPKRA